MKCRILHASKGRLRVHLEQKRMTLAQADMVEYYLKQVSSVSDVKVYDRTCDVVIYFEGDRQPVVEALSVFSYDKAANLVPEHTGRALNREYEDKLANAVMGRMVRKVLVPAPIRHVISVVKAIGHVRKGANCLLHGKIEVPVLDATAITVSLLRQDFNTASSIMFMLKIGEILEEWTHKKSVDD